MCACMCVYHCVVYKGDVYDLMDRHRAETSTDTDCAVLLLIPVRLGGETLNSVYFPCLKVRLTDSLYLLGGVLLCSG